MSDPKPATIAAPEIQILSQYIKDLSFENPKGRAAFKNDSNLSDTKIDLNARVENKKVSETEHEVTLEIKGKVSSQNMDIFIIELSYCGLFNIKADQEILKTLLYVDCPHLLFPFAREIMASVTKNSGFPPMLLSPINFAQMYIQNITEQQEKIKKEDKMQEKETKKKETKS